MGTSSHGAIGISAPAGGQKAVPPAVRPSPRALHDADAACHSAQAEKPGRKAVTSGAKRLPSRRPKDVAAAKATSECGLEIPSSNEVTSKPRSPPRNRGAHPTSTRRWMSRAPAHPPRNRGAHPTWARWVSASGAPLTPRNRGAHPTRRAPR